MSHSINAPERDRGENEVGHATTRCPMRRESAPTVRGNSAAPLALRFADLFDHLGTIDLRYSAAARALSGSEIMIEGFQSRSQASSRPCRSCSTIALGSRASPVPCTVGAAMRRPDRFTISLSSTRAAVRLGHSASILRARAV
jgi:hypothetical protein